MSGRDDDEGYATYTSPPCSMQVSDPARIGLSKAFELHQRADVMRWRKAERERLIAARLAIRTDLRRECSVRIAARLEEAIGAVAGLTVVIARGQPPRLRAWAPGAPLQRDACNIPAPAQDAHSVQPDVVIAPVVGFDPARYRLGYGGGFSTAHLMPCRSAPASLGSATARPPSWPSTHCRMTSRWAWW